MSFFAFYFLPCYFLLFKLYLASEVQTISPDLIALDGLMCPPITPSILLRVTFPPVFHFPCLLDWWIIRSLACCASGYVRANCVWLHTSPTIELLFAGLIDQGFRSRLGKWWMVAS
jgi:hypothetical protein